MKSDRGKWSFSMVRVHGPTSKKKKKIESFGPLIDFQFFKNLVLEDLVEDMLVFSFYDCHFFFHDPTNIKLKHVTSTYYHCQYLVFVFTLNVTYFHRVIDKLHKKNPQSFLPLRFF